MKDTLLNTTSFGKLRAFKKIRQRSKYDKKAIDVSVEVSEASSLSITYSLLKFEIRVLTSSDGPVV